MYSADLSSVVARSSVRQEEGGGTVNFNDDLLFSALAEKAGALCACAHVL